MMTSWDRLIWARTVWAEARGEDTAGMRAVAHVIWNRHQSGLWYAGKGVADLCMLPEQFSCWNTNDRNRRAMNQCADDEPFLQIASGLIDAIILGDADPTLGASHYYAENMILPPEWAKTGQMTIHLGKHLFYKGVQ